MALFRRINLRGTTVVIATHNKELLRNTDQRIVFLQNGTIQE
jgi:cell division transport system ATP-binding protein